MRRQFMSVSQAVSALRNDKAALINLDDLYILRMTLQAINDLNRPLPFRPHLRVRVYSRRQAMYALRQQATIGTVWGGGARRPHRNGAKP